MFQIIKLPTHSLTHSVSHTVSVLANRFSEWSINAYTVLQKSDIFILTCWLRFTMKLVISVLEMLCYLFY